MKRRTKAFWIMFWIGSLAPVVMVWALTFVSFFGQRWIVHHDDLLAAVVLLGEMLGVEWRDG